MTFYVTYNTFHSDLIVSEAALRRFDAGGATLAAVERLRPAPFAAIGWGDMRFYRGQGFGWCRALDALRAAAWPGNTPTIHVQRSEPPTPNFNNWTTVQLRLSLEDFRALLERLDQDFVLQNGRPTADRDASSPREIYFRGRGAFSAANDCNHWIGRLIGSGGTPHNAVLDTVSWGLSLDLKLQAGGHDVHGPRYHLVHRPESLMASPWRPAILADINDR